MASLSSSFATSERHLDQAVRRLCCWRRAPTAPLTHRASYKEWMHFCIRLPRTPLGHLIVNLDSVERRLPSGNGRAVRVIALACADEWRGEVVDVDERDTNGAAGQVDVQLGTTSLAWSRGAFHLSLRLKQLSADLRITPLVLPTVTSSVSFGPDHAMQWVVIPRLSASGVVKVLGRTWEFENELAYHDHNWGHFRWGGDLSWEWGFVNPDDKACPWTVVFVRVSDGRRHRTLSQGLLVWRNDVNVRTFQNREIDFALDGCHVGARPLTLPPAVGLLVPGAASGVPASFRLGARGHGDDLAIAYETGALARIVLPSDVDDFGVVVLNETLGRASVSGRWADEVIAFEGPAVVEFVRG